LSGSALVVRVSKPTTMTSVEAVHVDVDDTGTVDVQPQPKLRKKTGPRPCELFVFDIFGGALAMAASNAGLLFIVLGEYWNFFRLFVHTYWERRLSTGQLGSQFDGWGWLLLIYFHIVVGFIFMGSIQQFFADHVEQRWTYYHLLNRNIVVDFQNRHGTDGNHYRSCRKFWLIVFFLALWPLSVVGVVICSTRFSQGQGWGSLFSKGLQCFIFVYTIYNKIKKVRDVEINGLISLNSLLEVAGTDLEDSAKWLSKAKLIKEPTSYPKNKADGPTNFMSWLRDLQEKNLEPASYNRFRLRLKRANWFAWIFGPLPVISLCVFTLIIGTLVLQNVTEGVICPDDPRLDAASNLFDAWDVLQNPRTPACSNFTATYINGSD